ncbi:hypothetical protein ATANTOWER_002374 [Ataeniobius toweri]|uniref:Uncharacterized protein n=1 Tax=Ataeniobius toweri TaxID=208326 RepID=A0ABU7A167_9TELE|nr:hypothetical protein [Ataeniobius toweri]
MVTLTGHLLLGDEESGKEEHCHDYVPHFLGTGLFPKGGAKTLFIWSQLTLATAFLLTTTGRSREEEKPVQPQKREEWDAHTSGTQEAFCG